MAVARDAGSGEARDGVVDVFHHPASVFDVEVAQLLKPLHHLGDDALVSPDEDEPIDTSRFLMY